MGGCCSKPPRHDSDGNQEQYGNRGLHQIRANDDVRRLQPHEYDQMPTIASLRAQEQVPQEPAHDSEIKGTSTDPDCVDETCSKMVDPLCQEQGKPSFEGFMNCVNKENSPRGSQLFHSQMDNSSSPHSPAAALTDTSSLKVSPERQQVLQSPRRLSQSVFRSHSTGDLMEAGQQVLPSPSLTLGVGDLTTIGQRAKHHKSPSSKSLPNVRHTTSSQVQHSTSTESISYKQHKYNVTEISHISTVTSLPWPPSLTKKVLKNPQLQNKREGAGLTEAELGQLERYIKELEEENAQLKAYTDQLLQKVMEANPGLLEHK